MLNWYLIRPEDAEYLTRGHQARGEAMARAGYLAIVGIEATTAFLWRGTRAGLGRVARGYARWKDRRLTIRELSRLDERLLRDVGVDPHSLEVIAADLAERPARHRFPAESLRPIEAPAMPLLHLDLDCPEFKHAA